MTDENLPGFASTQYMRELGTEATARDRVLNLMMHQANTWVRSTIICSPRYGGSEGLRRLRELRKKGYTFRQRKMGDSTEREYMLITQPVTPSLLDLIKADPE